MRSIFGSSSKATPGLTCPGGTEPAERTHTTGPDRVGQDIQAGDLKQESCMIHEGDGDVVGGKFLVQLGNSGSGDGFRPLASSFQKQFEYARDRRDKSLRESWIVITFAIEVIGGCWQRYGNAQD